MALQGKLFYLSLTAGKVYLVSDNKFHKEVNCHEKKIPLNHQAAQFEVTELKSCEHLNIWLDMSFGNDTKIKEKKSEPLKKYLKNSFRYL